MLLEDNDGGVCSRAEETLTADEEIVAIYECVHTVGSFVMQARCAKVYRPYGRVEIYLLPSNIYHPLSTIQLVHHGRNNAPEVFKADFTPFPNDKLSRIC